MYIHTYWEYVHVHTHILIDKARSTPWGVFICGSEVARMIMSNFYLPPSFVFGKWAAQLASRYMYPSWRVFFFCVPTWKRRRFCWRFYDRCAWLVTPPLGSRIWEMLTFFPCQLFFGLFITSAYSLQDWSINTQISDMAPSEPLLENGILNPPGLALASADDSSEFARTPPKGGDIVNPDGILVQGGIGCPSDTRTHPRRVRARNKNTCPINLLRPNGEGEQERTLLHVPPNAQEGGDGQNTGGNGDPKPVIVITPEDSQLPYLFIPEENRPKENSEVCPEAMYPVPVCGRPSDTYLSSYTYPNQLTVDPCYPCMKFFFFSILSFFALTFFFSSIIPI